MCACLHVGKQKRFDAFSITARVLCAADCSISAKALQSVACCILQCPTILCVLDLYAFAGAVHQNIGVRNAYHFHTCITATAAATAAAE